MDACIPLNKLKPGQSGIVKSFLSSPSDSFRLREMGLLPGTAVKCIRRAPLGGPMQIRFRGSHFFLRRSDASMISLTLN